MRANLRRLQRTGDNAKQARHESGDARLWHIGAALAIGFAAAILGLAALTWLAWALLHHPKIPHPGTLSLHDSVSVLQLVFASVAGAGALVALIVAYRRQKVAEADSAHDRTRVFNERFATITAQLGDDKPAIRLAGVHAMAGLADDWEANRQTCIDVLCAYLRLPYEPDPSEEIPVPEHLVFLAGREVRHTAIRVIAAHLRDNAAVSWQGLNFDFTGVIFDGGDFRGAKFSGGVAVFDAAEFSGGTVRFNRAKFSGGAVFFGSAKFSGSTVRFDGAEFSGGTVSFRNTELSSGTLDFSGAKFSGSTVRFDGAKLSGSTVNFTSAQLSGGTVNFSGAQFSGSTVGFTLAEFSGGTVDFTLTKFFSGPVGFGGAGFSGGTVRFDGAKFSGGPVRFGGAKFSGSTVSFSRAEFSSGTVGFGGAEFSGGTVDFTLAKFPGGTVDFSGAADWSNPPKFSPPLSSAVELPTASRG